MMFSTRMLHEMCWPEGLSVSKLKSTRNVFKTKAQWDQKSFEFELDLTTGIFQDNIQCFTQGKFQGYLVNTKAGAPVAFTTWCGQQYGGGNNQPS